MVSHETLERLEAVHVAAQRFTKTLARLLPVVERLVRLTTQQVDGALDLYTSIVLNKNYMMSV